MANYKKPNKTGVRAMVNSLQEFEGLQEKYGLEGVQCIRELKDTIIGIECGVHLINKDQDAFDGMGVGMNPNIPFENKNVGINSKKINCTFPDLPENKLGTLENGDGLLTISIWDKVVDPKFVLVGNAKNISSIIRKKWNRIDPKRRKNVTISYKELIDNGFDIVLMNSTFSELIDTLKTKYPSKKTPKSRTVQVYSHTKMKEVINSKLSTAGNYE